MGACLSCLTALFSQRSDSNEVSTPLRSTDNTKRTHKYSKIKNTEEKLDEVIRTDNAEFENTSYLDQYRKLYADKQEEAKAFLNINAIPFIGKDDEDKNKQMSPNNNRSPGPPGQKPHKAMTAYDLLRLRSREEWEYSANYKGDEGKDNEEPKQQISNVKGSPNSKRSLHKNGDHGQYHVTFNIPPSPTPNDISTTTSNKNESSYGTFESKEDTQGIVTPDKTIVQNVLEESNPITSTTPDKPLVIDSVSPSPATGKLFYCYKCRRHLPKSKFSKNQLGKKKKSPGTELSCKACNMSDGG